mmetsp:Transcript_85535/g.149080  ORF Transcript_85535/g.149080 Transcript_85535/m.149080 type:complete len:845 (-) Transcript_85535:8-2542(-)
MALISVLLLLALGLLATAALPLHARSLWSHGPAEQWMQISSRRMQAVGQRHVESHISNLARASLMRREREVREAGHERDAKAAAASKSQRRDTVRNAIDAARRLQGTGDARAAGNRGKQIKAAANQATKHAKQKAWVEVAKSAAPASNAHVGRKKTQAEVDALVAKWLRSVEEQHTNLTATETKGMKGIRVEEHWWTQKKEGNAVVTHICEDRWVPGALALAASLKMVHSKADRVLMVSRNVSDTWHDTLERNFDRVYVEDPIKPHPSVRRGGADCLTLQLRTWELPYVKALYMDADMIALRNPDVLFDDTQQVTEVIARTDRLPEFGFNGGMFLCEPNKVTFAKLWDGLVTYNNQGWNHGMQQFMNHMFPRCNSTGNATWIIAGCWSKEMSTLQNYISRDLLPNMTAPLLQGKGEIQSLHFSGDWHGQRKPWMKGCMMKADSTHKNESMKHDILNVWMRAYNQVQPASGQERLVKTECPFYDCGRSNGTMDFVVHLQSLDCIAHSVLVKLLQHAAPRRVLLLAPGPLCARFYQHWTKLAASRVQCVDQNSVLSEVSLEGVNKWLVNKFSKLPLGSNKTNPDKNRISALASLYYDQFVKMGVAKASEKLGLSENYVLWDPELLLIRDFCPFTNDGKINIMGGSRPRDDVCVKEHQASFENLFGLGHKYLADFAEGLAPVHMVMNKHTMAAMLENASKRFSVSAESADGNWTTAFLEASCQTLQGCICGFSEHTAYASWALLDQHEKFAPAMAGFYRNYTPDLRLTKLPPDASVAPMTPEGHKAKFLRIKNRKGPDAMECCPSFYDFGLSEKDLGSGHQYVMFNHGCLHGLKDVNLTVMMTKLDH